MSDLIVATTVMIDEAWSPLKFRRSGVPPKTWISGHIESRLDSRFHFLNLSPLNGVASSSGHCVSIQGISSIISVAQAAQSSIYVDLNNLCQVAEWSCNAQLHAHRILITNLQLCTSTLYLIPSYPIHTPEMIYRLISYGARSINRERKCSSWCKIMWKDRSLPVASCYTSSISSFESEGQMKP